MQNFDATPSRSGKVTRRSLAAGAIWSVPAVVMATPAHAAVVSGQILYKITVSALSGASQTATVTIVISNGLKAFTVNGITLEGFTASKGSLVIGSRSPGGDQVVSLGDERTFTFALSIANPNGRIEYNDPTATFTTTPGVTISKGP